ncbi:MAG: glycosyltransferase family 4 protein [Candidatus Acidiferrales bacterium]
MVAAMKVLHIVKTAVGANWAYEQVRVLCSLGIEVVVALPSDTEGLAPKYRQAGATVLRANLDFPSHHLWRLPEVSASLRRLVHEVHPDLIHTHHVGTTLALRVALGKHSSTPRIFQVPGPLHLEHDFFAHLDTRLAGPKDYWIATCQWTRRKYMELGVQSHRVFVSYAATDLKSFTGARTGSLRHQLGISPDTPLVGMVAYMYAPMWYLGQERGLKGHEDFMAALSIVKQAYPNIRAVIVGGAWGKARWYEDRLRYLGERLCDGFLTFLGPRSDIPAIYPDLDLAVVPSYSENCGGAVEPLLSGVPVVATNVGGLPDLVQDGKTGWLVPPRNPGALARAILDALQSTAEARRRALEGQKLARTLFDVERNGREIAAIYEKILVRQSSPSIFTASESRDSVSSKSSGRSEIAARAGAR